jgi:anaphase-promoting complex subunit 2
LEIFDHLCGDIVVEVVQNKIQSHIEMKSIDNYQISFINSFERWLQIIIIGWIKLIYSHYDHTGGGGINSINSYPLDFDEYLINYRKQLAHFMYTQYADVRIRRLFDIVIDFPDSKSAIDDLRVCLEKTNLRNHVVESLKMSIEQRLLHPGVNTSDILSAYVSAIKALTCLDSTGVMMENVCEPLKKYLRNRDDTVKCIVSNLTDDADSSSDLMEEFCKDLYTYENGTNGNSKEKNEAVWQYWTPDPIDALPASLATTGSGSDETPEAKSNIISMLVNIYGSKDLFVNEYKTLLGDRLLSNYAHNMEKEIRNLELLKLRFGESNLFACEAMLKDISESKRINSNVLDQLKNKGEDKMDLNGDVNVYEISAATLKCLILSEQFWPKLKEEKIELSASLRSIQDKFRTSYETFKGNRTLIWKNYLGLVTIDLEINGNVLEFNVTPIQASIIMKFEEKESWPIHELATSLKMCSFSLRKKLQFWKMQGLIKETENQEYIENEDQLEASNEIYTLVNEYNKVF